jgi:hypothetical protein
MKLVPRIYHSKDDVKQFCNFQTQLHQANQSVPDSSMDVSSGKRIIPVFENIPWTVFSTRRSKLFFTGCFIFESSFKLRRASGVDSNQKRLLLLLLLLASLLMLSSLLSPMFLVILAS